MKINLFFFTCFLIAVWSILCVPASAQAVRYEYNAAGNRVARSNVIHMPLKSADAQSGTGGATETAQVDLDPFEETIAALTITIYPNPTQGQLRVELTGKDVPPGARIFLYNLSGALVRQWNNISGMNTVDISEQPVGTYIMRIVLDNETVSTWRIIKE